MHRKRFELWHSILGMAGLLIAEEVLARLVSGTAQHETVVLSLAAVGGAAIIFVATEAIEEVHNIRHMLVLLSVVVFEFIIFFAFQYWFLQGLFPDMFQNLSFDPISMLLQSVMVFVFNPVYLPESISGRALLLINTLESLVLVLFVLQNIWQFRTRTFLKSEAETQ